VEEEVRIHPARAEEWVEVEVEAEVKGPEAIVFARDAGKKYPINEVSPVLK